MSPVPVQVQLRQVQLSAVRSLWQVQLAAGAAHCARLTVCSSGLQQFKQPIACLFMLSTCAGSKPWSPFFHVTSLFEHGAFLRACSHLLMYRQRRSHG